MNRSKNIKYGPMANLLFDMRNLAKVLGCESISVKTSTSIFDTDWKHQHEEKALRLFESVYGEDVKQSGLKIHPKHTFLGTTTDGILNDGILTICCPRTRSIWGSIPHTSWIRMQIEMEVFDTNKAYFFQVEYPEERYRLQIVNRDTIWFNEVLPEIRKSMSRKRKRDVENEKLRIENEKLKTMKQRSIKILVLAAIIGLIVGVIFIFIQPQISFLLLLCIFCFT